MSTNSGVTAAKRRRAGNDVNKSVEPEVKLSDERGIIGEIKEGFKRYSIQDALQLTVQKLVVLEHNSKNNNAYIMNLNENHSKFSEQFTDYKATMEKLIKNMEFRIQSLEDGHVKDNKLNLKDVDVKVEKVKRELDATRNVVLSIQNSVLSKNLNKLGPSGLRPVLDDADGNED